MQANYKVGQEVVVVHNTHYGSHYAYGYTVNRVTPTGQVVVKRDTDGLERRFDKRGREMGRPGWNSNYWLEADVEACKGRDARKMRTVQACEALKLVRVDQCQPTYSKEHLLEEVARLQALLMEAAKLVAEI